jgi:tryptophanyl-tRNA synthetase
MDKGKMSKSENENATLYLADTDEMIRKKVMKTVSGDAPSRNEFG